jgi:hypothetical protein
VQVGRSCAGRVASSVSSFGRRLGGAPAAMAFSSSRSSSSSSSADAAAAGRGSRAARVRGCG